MAGELELMSKAEAAGYVIGAARRVDRVMSSQAVKGPLTDDVILACGKLNEVLEQYDRVRAGHASKKEMTCAKESVGR